MDVDAHKILIVHQICVYELVAHLINVMVIVVDVILMDGHMFTIIIGGEVLTDMDGQLVIMVFY